MFQIQTTNPRVIHRRRAGRLMRPSDRMIATAGLGDFMDTLKNFGSGIVQAATFGIYDPRKSRFYVPFSSGQMRNWAQGYVNTATLGLVRTDKFFGSQTVRTIGTVAGGVAAGAAAYFGGSALMKSFGSTPAPGAPGAPGSNVYGPPAPTSSLLSNVSVPSLSTVKTGLEVLSMGSKVMGGTAPMPQQQQQPGVVIMTGDNAQYTPPGMYDPSQYMLQPGGGVMYPPPGGEMGFGPGMMMGPPGGGGGGGGVGPPGSEYMIDPMTGQPVPIEGEGMSIGMKIALVAGVGVVAFYFIKK